MRVSYFGKEYQARISSALVHLVLLAFLLTFGLADLWASQSDESLLTKSRECLLKKDYSCEAKFRSEYLKRNPDNALELARLGIAQQRQGKHEEALASFEKSMDLGRGTYTLFAYYAESLAFLGRNEEAVIWYYNSLAVNPKLVDVPQAIVSLLLKMNRPLEAQSLLLGMEYERAKRGQKPYFKGNLIAVERRLKSGANSERELKEIRLPKVGKHYFLPLKIGKNESSTFLVDTGATSLTFDDTFLEKSGTTYAVIANAATAKLANGETIQGKRVLLDEIFVGSKAIRNVQAFVCPKCVQLAGQTVLERFVFSTTEEKGADFLVLRDRF